MVIWKYCVLTVIMGIRLLLGPLICIVSKMNHLTEPLQPALVSKVYYCLLDSVV